MAPRHRPWLPALLWGPPAHATSPQAGGHPPAPPRALAPAAPGHEEPPVLAVPDPRHPADPVLVPPDGESSPSASTGQHPARGVPPGVPLQRWELTAPFPPPSSARCRWRSAGRSCAAWRPTTRSSCGTARTRRASSPMTGCMWSASTTPAPRSTSCCCAARRKVSPLLPVTLCAPWGIPSVPGNADRANRVGSC